MQDDPRYDDVVGEVAAFLEKRLAAATAAGIAEDRIHLDPGIGFGKTVEHNLELLRRLPELTALGRPVVLGLSRKRFLARIAVRAEDRLAVTPPGDRRTTPPGDRLAATLAANVLGLRNGATVFRVHDVAPHREALTVAARMIAERTIGAEDPS
jgi:dihydropteroate synthase